MGVGVVSPHRGWKGTILPENATLGRRYGAEPAIPWDRLPAHPKAAMMSIKVLQRTAAAVSAYAISSSLGRRPLLSYVVTASRFSPSPMRTPPAPHGYPSRRLR